MGVVSWRDPVGWWCALGRPLARLPRGGALAVLLALVLALGWAAWATPQLGQADDARVAAKSGEAIGDLELYERIHDRVAAGENYYAAAVAEQRANDYPTQPFVTVRLPTLAYIDALLGENWGRIAAMLLLVAVILAWLRALKPVVLRTEVLGTGILLYMAGMGLFDPRALQFHELVAGALLGLALAIYRPDRWWPSLVAAALALAIRELALPFLLLWGAFAASERRWRQVLAIGIVIGLFVLAMVFHAQAVAQHVLPTDPASPPWAGFNGPQLALLSLARLTPLLMLPEAVAAPIALLALLGWVGLGGRLGLFAALWFAGMGLAMALFARTNNFYWVLLVLPAYAAGLAFVPRALAELVRGAIGRQKSQS